MRGDLTGEEWDDAEFGRALRRGILVGAPLLWLVMTCIGLLGGMELGAAAGLALLPAFFIGPWAGGLIFMGTTSRRHEHHGEVVELHQPEERRAA